MTEQGLKAVIYPELDEAQMELFIRDFTERLGSSYVTMGANINASTSSAVQPSSDGGDDKNVVEKTVGKIGEKTGDKMAEKFLEKLPDILDGTTSLKDITKSLGGTLGKTALIGTAVGVGAIGIVEIANRTFKFLESSSEPLRRVMSLFTMAFDMIWMPIGTVIAIKMMPILQGVFTKVADWMSIAMDVFEEEGLVGMFSIALGLTWDIISTFLLKPELWEFIGRLFWTILNTGLLLLLSPLIGPENAFKFIQNALDFLITVISAIWHALSFDTVALAKDIEKIGGSVSGIFDGILEKIPDFLGKIVEWIKNNTQLGKLIQKLIDYFGVDSSVTTVAEKYAEKANYINSAGEKWENGDYFGAIGDAFKAGIKNTPLGRVGEKFGLWADGGIITQPTLGIAGEAGPEAVIPLNRLHQVADDYRTVAGGGSGNVMNFYINGNNAMEIGEEVQRILEKTVGKASSKLMWW